MKLLLSFHLQPTHLATAFGVFTANWQMWWSRAAARLHHTLNLVVCHPYCGSRWSLGMICLGVLGDEYERVITEMPVPS